MSEFDPEILYKIVDAIIENKEKDFPPAEQPDEWLQFILLLQTRTSNMFNLVSESILARAKKDTNSTRSETGTNEGAD